MEDAEANYTFETMMEEEVRIFASLSPAPDDDYDDEWRFHRDCDSEEVETFQMNTRASRANFKVMHKNFMSYLNTNPFCQVPHPPVEGHHCLKCGVPNARDFKDDPRKDTK